MNRKVFILFTLSVALVCAPIQSADAGGGHGGRGHGGGSGHKGGFGKKTGFGHKGGFGHGGFGHKGGFGHRGAIFGGGFGDCSDIYGFAELYRELLDNVPFYALHPPVYYSYPVPRPYGYSPFAYPGYVMTPDVACAVEPLEIINPHVETPEAKTTEGAKPERSAATSARIEPLVVINPFVAPNQAVAQVDR